MCAIFICIYEKKGSNFARKILKTPSLICSISTECNLSCKGCYARANGIADNPGKSTRPTLTPEQWRTIFTEASSLGINFALLAGGEPMMRKDILEEVAKVEDMIFPIFTNGTLIGPSYIAFLKEHLNLIPVISIEGAEHGTDTCRSAIVQRSMVVPGVKPSMMVKTPTLSMASSITT